MDLSLYALPLLVTLLAGLSTGVGGAMAFFSREFNPRLLSVALGFSAGVMVYVSFMEIMPKAEQALSAIYGPDRGYWFATIGFFGGVAFIGLLDFLVPSGINPHEFKSEDQQEDGGDGQSSKLLRMGVFSAMAIALHNFPEGLATFMATLEDPVLGVTIALAIAIHNIPEGVAIAIPLYYATKNRHHAFLLSLSAGLAEPVGAIVGYLILMQIFSDAAFGIIFSSVAGIMVYVSLDELLPAASEFGKHHLSIAGFIAGMAVMALSLVLLR